MLKLFEYASAVRGDHYYRKYWQLKESQSLDCVYEKHNPFDFFAIKVMEQDTGATVVSILTSANYCVPPLVQGGLEIPYRVEIYISPTVKNNQLTGMY